MGLEPMKVARLDGNSGALHDFRDGANVVLVRAGGAVGPDLNFRVRPISRARASQCAVRTRTGARQPKIERVDTELLHQMEDTNLLFDGRIAHRGRLQPVAQRFVIQQDPASRHHRARIDSIPIVNKIRNVGSHFFSTPHIRRPTRRSTWKDAGWPVPLTIIALKPSYGLSFSSPGLPVSVNPNSDG